MAVLGLYWLRQELFEISAEQWYLDRSKRRGVLGMWATRDEILGLSVADVALAVAQADGEALIRAIVRHHKRQDYPVFLIGVARSLLGSRARRLRVTSY